MPISDRFGGAQLGSIYRWDDVKHIFKDAAVSVSHSSA